MEQLGIDKTPEEFIESLPPPIKRRVEALQALQEQKDDLEGEFRRERAELEAKYDKLYGELGNACPEKVWHPMLTRCFQVADTGTSSK